MGRGEEKGFRMTPTAAWVVGPSSELGNVEKGQFAAGWMDANQHVHAGNPGEKL